MCPHLLCRITYLSIRPLYYGDQATGVLDAQGVRHLQQLTWQLNVSLVIINRLQLRQLEHLVPEWKP